MNRKVLIEFAVTMVALLVLPAIALAQPYPSRPIKIIVPFAAGSGSDTIARVLGEEMQRHLGVPIIVDNRVGASGIVGVDFAAKAPPDGYTLLLTSVTTITANPFLFKKIPYDPVKDFTPIAIVLDTKMVLLVGADSKVRTPADLVTALRDDPGRATYGYGSGASQINGAAFAKRMNAPALAVPYKSSPQAVTDLIGGQFTYMFLDSAGAVAQVRGGRVRALAVASDARLGLLPEVPTFTELAISGFSSVGWVGLFAPAGVNALHVEKIAQTVIEILKQQSVKERLESSGTVTAMGPKQFETFLARQRVAWGEQIKDAGIEPQ